MSKVNGSLSSHEFWLRLRLWGILGLCVCLMVTGCASLGKVTGLATGGGTSTETSKSEAYYHFLKAQQLLVADDVGEKIWRISYKPGQ